MFEEVSPGVPAPSSRSPGPLGEPADPSPAVSTPHQTGPMEPSSREGEEDSDEPAPLDDQELSDWKEELRREFESWLETVDSVPEVDITELAPTPDLFGFYREFAASTAEARRSNRRTAEAFSQWGDTLSRFDTELRSLRESVGRPTANKGDGLPRSWCLALIEILDRLQRLAAALRNPPPARWWGQANAWRQAWKSQQQALAILIGHTDALLSKAGITRIVTVGETFDPMTMSATATSMDAGRPHHTVVEELAAGYRLQEELIRVAEVKVSVQPQ